MNDQAQDATILKVAKAMHAERQKVSRQYLNHNRDLVEFDDLPEEGKKFLLMLAKTSILTLSYMGAK